MIDWTPQQKSDIWHLYSVEQLTFAVIAERYSHLGATRSAISGLIGRINKERDAEVDADIAAAHRRHDSYRTRYKMKKTPQVYVPKGSPVGRKGMGVKVWQDGKPSIVFESLSAAVRHIKGSETGVRRAMEYKKPYKGWNVEKVK